MRRKAGGEPPVFLYRNEKRMNSSEKADTPVKQQKLPRLDARLSAALPFVRAGSLLCDVGTDHAYLPIYLTLTGKIRGAVATDINEGPIARADANIFSAGLAGKIRTLCTDGLHGAETDDPDDVLIFGMGGDLIVRIIREAPFLYAPGKRLILQPMTHAETVRAALARDGFRITGETLAKTDRIYQIICADYDGVARTLTPAEAWLGPCNIARGGELFRDFVRHEIKVLSARARGKQSAGDPAEAECAWIHEMEGYL